MDEWSKASFLCQSRLMETGTSGYVEGEWKTFKEEPPQFTRPKFEPRSPRPQRSSSTRLARKPTTPPRQTIFYDAFQETRRNNGKPSRNNPTFEQPTNITTLISLLDANHTRLTPVTTCSLFRLGVAVFKLELARWYALEFLEFAPSAQASPLGEKNLQ
uniref:Uncharacterized protein n=1 Tax=Timema tahoe TaxID=61484 RepID=A0A7R9P047_9NEOP|nr:unnamed protein product [Timema tahoe]